MSQRGEHGPSGPLGAPEGADVVAVGGGVIGLAIAWRARQRGLSVTVVDPAPGRAASWAAAGMLAPVTEVHYGEEPLLRLNLASAERYASFVAELEDVAGTTVGYRPCGTLAVAVDAGDSAVLDDLFRFQQRLGLGVERVTAREARRLEPALSPAIRGGLFVDHDHQVDNRLLGAALLAACLRSGVEIVAATVTAVAVQGGRAAGVVLDDGHTATAGAVVLAAGCWSARIAGASGLPVRPVKGQILRLRHEAETSYLSHNVRGIVQGSSIYVVPRASGEVVVGATVEEQGFDTAVTAGGVYQLLRDAHALLPDIGELTLAETHAGLRPGTPDNAPLLGPTATAGLVAATGHYRNGILLTPVTADTVADLLADGRVPELIAPFSPLRFGPS
jgi:glycine oxidase